MRGEGGVGGGRGLITSCPRFDVDVAEEGRRFRPFPASAIAFGDGGRSKGRTRKSNVACFKRLGHPWPQKFSTVGKKEPCKFPPAVYIRYPPSAKFSSPFIRFIFPSSNVDTIFGNVLFSFLN